MPKIVFIGAGSLGFTRGLVRDILTFPLLRNSELALVDINKERLDFARRACEKIVALGNYPAKVTATTKRREVLKGADAVCITILCGDVNVWKMRRKAADQRRRRERLPRHVNDQQHGHAKACGEVRGGAGLSLFAADPIKQAHDALDNRDVAPLTRVLHQPIQQRRAHGPTIEIDASAPCSSGMKTWVDIVRPGLGRLHCQPPAAQRR